MSFISALARVGPGVRLRSGEGSRIGFESAVVSSVLAPRTRIPDRVIYLNNAVVGRVEW